MSGIQPICIFSYHKQANSVNYVVYFEWFAILVFGQLGARGLANWLCWLLQTLKKSKVRSSNKHIMKLEGIFMSYLESIAYQDVVWRST